MHQIQNKNAGVQNATNYSATGSGLESGDLSSNANAALPTPGYKTMSKLQVSNGSPSNSF